MFANLAIVVFGALRVKPQASLWNTECWPESSKVGHPKTTEPRHEKTQFLHIRESPGED